MYQDIKKSPVHGWVRCPADIESVQLPWSKVIANFKKSVEHWWWTRHPVKKYGAIFALVAFGNFVAYSINQINKLEKPRDHVAVQIPMVSLEQRADLIEIEKPVETHVQIPAVEFRMDQTPSHMPAGAQFVSARTELSYPTRPGVRIRSN